MKKANTLSRLLSVLVFVGVVALPSCKKNLLKQQPTTELPSASFWKTESDALYALMGAYSATRPLFDRDYYFEGQGEYTRVRGTSATTGNLRLGDAYQGANYDPTGYGDDFDKYYRFLYGGVNHANYVIENTTKLLSEGASGTPANLETIIGEARLLRGMVYFRLISMWGDVPYFTNVVDQSAEIPVVSNLPRTPIAQIKD